MINALRRYLMPFAYLDGANMVTLLNLAIAALALMLTFHSATLLPVLLVFIAILLDHLDGYLARRFYAHDRLKRGFGKQLDTLADLVNFNVVTAMLVFTQCAGYPVFAGIVAALLVMCGAVRLSHFTLHSGDGPEAAFGLQTPYAAFIVLLLLLLQLSGRLPGGQGTVLALTALCTLLQIARVPIRMPSARLLVSGMTFLFVLTLWVTF
ncbi:CDP-alcohol phosphatidyltransferase family protein [Pseudescherichia sp.]|uniref:CDP-alcohol phosphatidyltransferase family protein n=1 Tax=Pseudescherichia sp. TaxID=2055881 RepID=UPI0028A185DE|nr:CDP-alcohol phosphatidyltransferase family protein [Pseudescherichia sp.]